jgi:predicted nucleic acid-binding protein
MSGRSLLDTNIVIALFANEAAIIEQIRGVNEVFIPSVAMGHAPAARPGAQTTHERSARAWQRNR